LIAEVFLEAYDAAGRKVFRPDSRRTSGFRPTFPAGRFLSQPLKHWCSDFVDMRKFLAKCKYVSDQEQFGQKDYWQPPELFEETRKGDCEDFALWSWRQLMQMNYPCRFVVGRAGRFGAGHAWLTFEKDGRTYLLESLSWGIGLKMPRLRTLRYHPKYSMEWNGKTVSYYSHEDRKFDPSLQTAASLVGEWIYLWGFFWVRLVASVAKRLRAKLMGRSGVQHSSEGTPH
jgi:hypothetical protein